MPIQLKMIDWWQTKTSILFCRILGRRLSLILDWHGVILIDCIGFYILRQIYATYFSIENNNE